MTDRVPVWTALAELYLDVELDEGALAAIVAVLARSPYSVAALRDIERWEVAPVVWPNLVSVAGAWTAFDAAWLAAECAKRARRRGLVLRVAMRLGFHRFVRKATGRYWERLGSMIDAARAA